MKKLAIVFLVFLLSGCVAGQHIKVGGVEKSQPEKQLNVQVNLNVEDKRTYVTSGDKEPYYIGHYRAGLGNTWDVTTYQKQSLADLLSKDLSNELLSLGFTLGSDQFDKKLIVNVNDWNFDMYINGKMWWDLDVLVVTADGNLLASEKLKEERIIEGNILTGAKSAFERNVPLIYLEIVKNTIRNNQAVMNALLK